MICVADSHRAQLFDLIQAQDFYATAGKLWTVDQFMDAVFAIFEPTPPTDDERAHRQEQK